jgi:hypothetical protein
MNNKRLVDKNILLNIYEQIYSERYIQVQSLFKKDNFQIFGAVDATGSCLFDSMRHIVNSKNNNIKLNGKSKIYIFITLLHYTAMMMSYPPGTLTIPHYIHSIIIAVLLYS